MPSVVTGVGAGPAEQKILKAFVVIAAQADHAVVGCHAGDQEIQYAFRVGSAVAIVADMHDAPVSRPFALDLRVDAGVHGDQQVAAAVDVADGVEPHALGRLGVQEMHTLRHASRPPR